MKIPLAYESTLFDSAPVSVENGLRILLSDTSIPSSLVMRIHVLLSDRVLPDGSVTTGRGALAHLSHSINENYSSILKATYLQGREVFLGPGCLLFEALRSGGVAVGRNPQGLSWTQNLETAKWFANRFNTDTKKGYVQVGIAKKEHVLAYFNTRGEDEIVYNSKKLDISILKEV